MGKLTWNTYIDSKTLQACGFIKFYDKWVYDELSDGRYGIVCIGTIELLPNGNVEAAGEINENLLDRLFYNCILLEEK